MLLTWFFVAAPFSLMLRRLLEGTPSYRDEGKEQDVSRAGLLVVFKSICRRINYYTLLRRTLFPSRKCHRREVGSVMNALLLDLG